MARVHHRIGVRATREELFSSLVEPEKLTGWWASTAERGDTLRLGFTGLTVLEFEVVEVQRPELLLLTCLGEPEGWRDSTLEFRICAGDAQTFLYLTHSKDSASESDFLYFNTKWPLFMVSLKDFLELGQGRPFPHDQQIQHA